jgi:hypothetical protein
MLNEEKSTKTSDGFIARFVLSCPKPMKRDLKQLLNLGDKKTILPTLLATIKVMHKKPKTYRFSNDAFEFLNSACKENDEISEKYESKEPIIR